MNLHSFKRTYRRQSRKRVGRGHGNNWGRTAGRGEKGQLSRSGANHRPHFEGGQITYFRRMPKKGFKSPFHKLYTVVNVSTLERYFEAGDVVDTEALVRKSLVGTDMGAGLKILATGEITKAITVKAAAFSAAAQAKIEAAGGSCECV